MSYEKRREDLIAYAVGLIHDDMAMPIDVLAELDEHGVNINWLFTEAGSYIKEDDEYFLTAQQGALL